MVLLVHPPGDYCRGSTSSRRIRDPGQQRSGFFFLVSRKWFLLNGWDRSDRFGGCGTVLVAGPDLAHCRPPLWARLDVHFFSLFQIDLLRSKGFAFSERGITASNWGFCSTDTMSPGQSISCFESEHFAWQAARESWRGS